MSSTNEESRARQNLHELPRHPGMHIKIPHFLVGVWDVHNPPLETLRSEIDEYGGALIYQETDYDDDNDYGGERATCTSAQPLIDSRLSEEDTLTSHETLGSDVIVTKTAAIQEGQFSSPPPSKRQKVTPEAPRYTKKDTDTTSFDDGYDTSDEAKVMGVTTRNGSVEWFAGTDSSVPENDAVAKQSSLCNGPQEADEYDDLSLITVVSVPSNERLRSWHYSDSAAARARLQSPDGACVGSASLGHSSLPQSPRRRREPPNSRYPLNYYPKQRQPPYNRYGDVYGNRMGQSPLPRPPDSPYSAYRPDYNAVNQQRQPAYNRFSGHYGNGWQPPPRALPAHSQQDYARFSAGNRFGGPPQWREPPYRNGGMNGYNGWSPEFVSTANQQYGQPQYPIHSQFGQHGCPPNNYTHGAWANARRPIYHNPPGQIRYSGQAQQWDGVAVQEVGEGDYDWQATKLNSWNQFSSEEQKEREDYSKNSAAYEIEEEAVQDSEEVQEPLDKAKLRNTEILVKKLTKQMYDEVKWSDADVEERDSWYKRYKELKAYKREHGHW